MQIYFPCFVQPLQEELPAAGERAGAFLSGTGKSFASGFANMAGTMQEATAGANPWNNYLRMEHDAAVERGDTRRAEQAGQKLQEAEAAPAQMQAAADRWALSGARDLETAKAGLDTVGRVGIDAGSAGLQMAADAALGLENALPSMATRVFGGAAQEARQAGAGLEEQLLYGASSAALSIATEKLSNISAPFRNLFGEGVLDRAISSAVGKLGETSAGKIALSFLSEGGEEIAEDLVQPLLQRMTYDKTALGQYRDPDYLAQTLYDGLIGGILGGIGGVEAIGNRLGGQAEQGTAAAAGQQKAASQAETAIQADTTLFDRGILKNFNHARKYLIDFAKAHFPSSVVNRATGKNIGISRTGLDKFLSGNILYEKYASGFHIPELVERATLVGQSENYHPETAGSIPTFEYYNSSIDIDGKRYNAHIRVKNTNTGDKYYGHTVSEIDDIKIESPTRVPSSETPTGQPEKSGDSMGSPTSGVNMAETTNTFTSETAEPELPVEGMHPLNPDSTIPQRADFVKSGQAAFSNTDPASLREVAGTLGESGQKALYRFYDRETDTGDYASGFVRAYQAGLSGKGQPSGLRIDSAQATAAYIAGQNDRAQVRYFGENAGLVRDERWKQAHLSTKTDRTLDALGKVLGTRIQFAESVEGGRANAQYRDGVITLALDAEDPVTVSAVHEAVHRVREAAPEAYQELADFITEAMSEEGLGLQLARRERLYQTQNTDALTEELVADAFGRMLEGGEALERFAAGHRTALEKLKDAIRDIVNAVRRALSGQNVRLSREQRAEFQELEGRLTAMERLFTDALETAAEQAGALQTGQADATMGAARNSLKEDGGRDGRERKIDSKIDGSIQGEAWGLDRETEAADTGARRELAASSGRHGGVDPSLGVSPYRTWAHGNTITPEKGTVAYVEQQTTIKYGVPSYVIADAAWEKNYGKKSAPAFSVRGQIYFRESLPERNRGMIAPHELTHVMRQIRFQPYLYFLEKTPQLLNMSDQYTQVALELVSRHQGATLETADPSRLYDEFNAMIYGSIAVGRTEVYKSGDGAQMFHDFEAYAAELTAIHEQFKNRDGKPQSKFSLKSKELLAEYAEKYGTIPAGEKPARSVQVPRRTGERERVSRTVRTILEAGATPEEAVPGIEELTARGAFSYEAYSDREAIADAEGRIRRQGWAQALADWSDSMGRGEVSKANTAMGWALYNNAANSGDVKTALTVLNLMVRHQRSAAQAVQATRILKTLSPEAQLYGVQRSVESLQEELNKRYGEKKGPALRVDETLAEQFMKAGDQEQRDAVLRDIYRDIGRQLPSRFRDKWNAWRYLAMLGNPRTHVRNVVGNAGFAPVVLAKDLTATAIEAAVSRVSGGRTERTKAMLGTGKADRALLRAAWDDYSRVQETALGGGKYSDFANANKYIEEGREIFKSKLLEKGRKANSAALDAEDVWFSKPHYAFALAQYCKAHNITAEQIAQGKGLEQARAYGILEAQKATYRDTNAFSQAVSEWGRSVRGGNNPVRRGVGMALEGILPFRKTPANILARGLEYSPAGFLKGLTVDLFRIEGVNNKVGRWAKKNFGEITPTEAIDHISAGLTGTGLLALGMYLAAEGLIRGHGGDDEKEKQFQELQGHQSYALELPDGTSVTLDWLAPECLPFFVGVNLWEQTRGEGEPVTMSELLTATANVTEPLLEMSCLQSLNDVFDAVGYASSDGLDGLPAAIASAATSYLTQGLPTLLGQAERTGQAERMTTYTEKSAFLTPDMQYTLGRASGRIPGWDFNQIPYIDAWGRTEASGNAAERAADNFFNPAFTSRVESSAMEQELERLYAATGEAGVFPSRAAKYFTVDGERKDLTAEEYVAYATEKGRTAYRLLTELTAGEDYLRMSDGEKVQAVKDAYELANQTAKAAVSDYKPDSWMEKAAEAEKKYGIPQETYISLRSHAGNVGSLKDEAGETIPNSRSLLIMQEVYATPGLTDRQRQAMFVYLGVGKTVRHYNKTLVGEKLREMERLAGR